MEIEIRDLLALLGERDVEIFQLRQRLRALEAAAPRPMPVAPREPERETT